MLITLINSGSDHSLAAHDNEVLDKVVPAIKKLLSDKVVIAGLINFDVINKAIRNLKTEG